MHVVSASRRTDIPAFYSRWFMERVRNGVVRVKNPFSSKLYEVSLRPEDVIGIVFWTRNAAPLIPHLDELDRRGLGVAFHYTIVDLPRVLDPASPPAQRAVETLRRLADRLGPERVRWRYDPIVLSNLTGRDHHLRTFEHLARSLEGATLEGLTSFVQRYGKVRRQFERLEAEQGLRFDVPDLDERRSLARELAAIAASRGMRLLACCCDDILGDGVEKAHCIAADLVARWWPGRGAPPRPHPTREQCGCAESRDIGAYDTCAHGCRYCYAVDNHEHARAYLRRHDPGAPQLGDG